MQALARCAFAHRLPTRSAAHCDLTATTAAARHAIRHGQYARHQSTAQQPGISRTSTPKLASNQSSVASFTSLTDQLDELAPRLEINADQIEILKEPSQFYQALKGKIKSARRRIYLSTLYVGKAEYELIATIRSALHENSQLTISILADAIRSTRESPNPSCASLLAPLVSEFGSSRVQIRLYHTPNLAGFRKWILPKRINEGWGLQHMKLYSIDDEVILSGANLSQDYFSDRLDRYHCFRSRELVQYYERIHNAVCSISFELQPNTGLPKASRSPPSLKAHSTTDPFSVTWPSSNSGPSPLRSPRAYIEHSTALLAPLIRPFPTTDSATQRLKKSDTLVYPIFQFAPLFPRGAPSTNSSSKAQRDYSTELPVLRILLDSLRRPPFAPTRWSFTAGYFNMTPEIRDLLLSSLQPSSSNADASSAIEQQQPHGQILTAHPHANGFFPSTGLSALLPPAYTHLASKFLAAAQQSGLNERVRLREWKKGIVGQEGGWSYHAKGLWIRIPASTPPTDLTRGTNGVDAQEVDGPSISLIGSSNFTKRSHTLDIESNALIITSSPDLRRRLGEEESWLGEWAGEKVDGPEGFVRREGEERRVRWWVKVALWVVSVVGGAL